MRRLSISILTLFSWFFIFYNIERIFSTINIASFVYLLAPALGLGVLYGPRILQLRSLWYMLVAAVCVVAMRWLLGYELIGAAFSLVVTEILATWITIWLSCQLARGIDEYQSAAATAICSHLVDRCRPFKEAQEDVIREVRRARHFGRSIAVLALSPQPTNSQESVDRFTEEFRSRLLNQYISARAAEFVSKELRQHDILTENNDDFLALLPEMDRESATELAETMRRELREHLGIDLKFGISMFPEDEVTAIGLVERAEEEVQKIHRVNSRATTNLRRPARASSLGEALARGSSEQQAMEVETYE